MKQKLLTDIELDVHELKYLMDSFTKEPTPTLSELLKRSITRMQGRLDELQQEVDAVQVISPSAVEETAEEEDEVAGSEEDSPVIIQSLESVVVKEDEEGEAIVAEEKPVVIAAAAETAAEEAAAEEAAAAAEEEEEEEEFASAALFFSLISSIDFTPVDATEGANLLSPIQCSNVNRGLYASLASSIATSTVGLLVALVFLGRIRARSAHSLFNRSFN